MRQKKNFGKFLWKIIFTILIIKIATTIATSDVNLITENHHEDNIVLQGYIIDAYNKMPLKYAHVHLQDKEGWKDIKCDEKGYYFISVSKGEVALNVDKKGYESFYYSFIAGEDSYFNVSLINGSGEVTYNDGFVIMGYVLDAKTSDPIVNATIKASWRENGSYYSITNYTDFTGFYRIEVPKHEISLHVSKNSYYSKYMHFYFENNSTWINVSLYPAKEVKLCGYVLNSLNREPIENAYVEIQWRNELGEYNWYHCYTNSSGFYNINLTEGETKLEVYRTGYFSNESTWFLLQSNLTWMNISLDPEPLRNSFVCGYVRDSIDGKPVDADINVMWRDEKGHEKWFYDETNSSGFYNISVPAGNVSINVEAEGYFSYSLFIYNTNYWHLVKDNETLWLNISMDKKLPPSTIVKGRIVDSSGKPISNAGVIIVDTKHPFNGVFGGETNYMGEFEVVVYKGHFKLLTVAKISSIAYPTGFYNKVIDLNITNYGEVNIGDIVLEKAPKDSVNININFNSWNSIDILIHYNLIGNAALGRGLADIFVGDGNGKINETEKNAVLELWKEVKKEFLGDVLEGLLNVDNKLIAIDDLNLSMNGFVGNVNSTLPFELTLRVHLNSITKFLKLCYSVATVTITDSKILDLTEKIHFPQNFSIKRYASSSDVNVSLDTQNITIKATNKSFYQPPIGEIEILVNGTGCVPANISKIVDICPSDLNESNGKYKYLKVTAQLEINKEGIYTLSAMLSDAPAFNEGRVVFATIPQIYLSKGVHNISILFDGKNIQKYRLNGTYYFFIDLYRIEESEEWMDYIEYASNATYSYTMFEEPPIMLTGVVRDFGNDIDD
ncbi:MAG: carboxypeptidase regulatory-like domain-containing protein, partial [Thermoplasmata archaeon]